MLKCPVCGNELIKWHVAAYQCPFHEIYLDRNSWSDIKIVKSTIQCKDTALWGRKMNNEFNDKKNKKKSRSKR